MALSDRQQLLGSRPKPEQNQSLTLLLEGEAGKNAYWSSFMSMKAAAT